MSRQIGVDVDLTICPSDYTWTEYLLKKCTMEEYEEFTLNYSPRQSLPYNLASLFPSVENPMQYWHDLDYDQFKPLDGSVDALERISKYFDIVFISHVEGGGHGASKCRWLKKHFPFLAGISYTREKFIHNKSVEYMIDDRLSHLKGFDIQKRILFNTPYTQDVECGVWKTMNSWTEVDSKFIKELL